jgi:hypothetical protein
VDKQIFIKGISPELSLRVTLDRPPLPTKKVRKPFPEDSVSIRIAPYAKDQMLSTRVLVEEANEVEVGQKHRELLQSWLDLSEELELLAGKFERYEKPNYVLCSRDREIGPEIFGIVAETEPGSRPVLSSGSYFYCNPFSKSGPRGGGNFLVAA